MSDLPSIEEELERKASETLAETLRELSQGKTSPEAAEASLRALWGATSGLIPHELMDLIAESIDAIGDKAPPPRTRVLVKGARTVIVTLPEKMRLDAQLLMTNEGQITNRSLIDSDDTHLEMNRKVEKTINALLKAGFKET